MKKKLLKIIMPSLIILMLIQKNVCGYYYNYHEVNEARELRPISNIIYLLILILFGALTSLIMLVLYSKWKVKKTTTEEFEKMQEQYEKYKFAFNIVSLACIYLIYVMSWFEYFFNVVLLFIPAIIFVVAIMKKQLGDKKIGNILCISNIIFIALIYTIFTIPVKKVISHNQKISEYADLNYNVDSIHNEDNCNVINAKELIQTIIEINNSNRKVSIKYANKIYTSEEELKELIDKIDSKRKYNAKESYDTEKSYKKGMYCKYNNIHYVNSIELTEAIPTTMEFQRINAFIGKNRKGSEVAHLIDEIISYNNNDELKCISIHAENIKNFNSKKLDKACYAINLYENENAEPTIEKIYEATKEMRKLSEKISSGKKYNIEFSTDTYTITITPTK